VGQFSIGDPGQFCTGGYTTYLRVHPSTIYRMLKHHQISSVSRGQ
jgi:hypothetical protein